MPQMAPMMWLILFLLFSFVLIMFSILNFWFFLQPLLENTKNTKSLSSSSLNWKW